MIVQSISMAVKAIFGNLMRSFLTVLGIIIGVFAVVVLVSISQGASDMVTSNVESLGTNLLMVNVTTMRENPLTLSDLNELANDPNIADIAPSVSGNAPTLKAGTESYTSGSIVGTTPAYTGIRNMEVEQGRFITNSDVNNRVYSAVVGITIADELYGSRDVIGETLMVNGYPFTIVGLLEEQGQSFMGNPDTTVIIPFTIAQRLFYQPKITSFTVSATSPDTVTAAEKSVTTWMDAKFPENPSANRSGNRAGGMMAMFSSSDNSNYIITNQSSILDTLESMLSTLTIMLGCIAAISLLVGGIGIMNIMLVSVSERTREIGIRKAIGATRGNVLIQFLIEALVVSVLGGLLGLGLSMVALEAITILFDFALSVSAGVAVLAIGFSMVIGIGFGLYPANKASKLNPIDALRYEG